MTNAATGRRVLLIGADGMRPDMLDPNLMPNVAKLAAGGVHFADHHAVYPSHTRVNMSSLASGTTPGRHGIVANTMLVPDATEDHIIDTADYRHLDALAAQEASDTLFVPTVGAFLEAGKRVAVAGAGSGGSNVLWTLKDRSRIVNTNTAYGIADLYDLREKLGEVPEPAGPNNPRTAYAARAVSEIFLDDPDNQVIVVWLNEPDAALHRFGLGSPESISALAGVDEAVGTLVEALERRGLREQFDVFFLSDHGHSTVRAHQTLRGYLEQASAETGIDVNNLTTASDFIYQRPGAREVTATELAGLVDWLFGQDWCDVVLAGREDLGTLPGVLRLNDVWNGVGNARQPLLAVSPVWTHDVNEFGIPGSVAALTTQAALKSSHGSLSPYDMHCMLIANGPSFQQGVVSHVPTGAIDVTPTLLTLLGRTLPPEIDGRVLWEGMTTPAGETPGSSIDVLTPQEAHPTRSPEVRLHRIGGTTYLHGAGVDSAMPAEPVTTS